MGDYIDRHAAIDAINTALDRETLLNRFVRKVAVDAVKALPSSQPERNTAEWIYGEKDGADGWYCSKCGFHIPWYYDYYGLKNIDFIRDFHTCPHCDAKMLKYTGMKGDQNG